MLYFKYLETTVINQNFIREEIKNIANSSNFCYHSVHNLLSSRLLSKYIKIQFSCRFYGFET
jgi:glycine/serine hydroxymethyltransferase